MSDRDALLAELDRRGFGDHPAVLELKRRMGNRGTAPESRVSAAEWSEDGTRAFRTGKSGTVYDANYLMDQSPGADQRRIEEYGPVAGRLANIGAGFDRATTMERNQSRREQMRNDYGFMGGAGAAALDLVDLASGVADTATLEASGAALKAAGFDEAADRRREMTEQQLTGGGVNTAAQISSMAAPVGVTAQGIQKTARAVGSPILAGDSVAAQLARNVGAAAGTYNIGVGNAVDYDRDQMRYVDNTDIGAMGPLIGLPEAETGVTMGTIPYIAGAAPSVPGMVRAGARAAAEAAPPMTNAAARQRALKIALEKGMSPEVIQKLEGRGAGEMLPMDVAPETAGAAARQLGKDGRIREAARARETGRAERVFNTTSDALGADAELLPENQRHLARTQEGEAARSDPVRYDRAVKQFEQYTDDVQEAQGVAREEGYKHLAEAKLPEQEFDLSRPEMSTTTRAAQELTRLADQHGVSGGARRSEDIRGVRYLKNGNREIPEPYSMPGGRTVDPVDHMSDELVDSMLGERGLRPRSASERLDAVGLSADDVVETPLGKSGKWNRYEYNFRSKQDPKAPRIEIAATRGPDGSVAIKTTHIRGGGDHNTLKGRGAGKGAYLHVIEDLRAKGATRIFSDNQVSPSAQAVYRSLRKDGFEVIENPDAPSGFGSPMFEVIPPKSAREQHSRILKDARLGETPGGRSPDEARELKNARSIWSSAERAELRAELKGKEDAQQAAADLAEAAAERVDSIESRTYTQDDAAIFNPLRIQQIKIEAQSKSDAAKLSGDGSAKGDYGKIAGVARDLLHRFETSDGRRPALIGDRYFQSFESALSKTETKDGVKLKGAYAEGQRALKQGEQPEAIRAKMKAIARRVEASDKLPEGGTMRGATRDSVRAAAMEELHAYRMGALRGYLDYIQNQTQEGAKLVNPANAQVQAKLEALFDNPKQMEDYLRYLADERRMQATEREVLYGSQTAARLEEGKQLEEAAGGRRFDVLNSLRGGISALVVDLIKPRVQGLSDAFVEGITAKVAKQLDQIMTATDLRKLAEELEKARQENRSPKLNRKTRVLLNALMTRAVAQEKAREEQPATSR